jgi:endonuclease/exonuclease/phosphatase (EEP) superfamily protein YafD
LGITEIAALLAFRPVERIHDLMGDMSQISMAINSYQQQVALRILQFNSEDRDTIDKAATEIGTATKETMQMIQEFVETKEENKSNKDTQ